MNENAKLWVEALRSGEYSQGRKVLRAPSGYCCLGVACEVYRQEKGIGKWDLTDDKYHVEGKSFRFVMTDGHDGYRLSLPTPVRDWLGLADDDATYGENGKGWSLAGDNDTREFSFQEIADIIEAEPEGLFA